MIEKLVYVAKQFPGHEIVQEIVSRFDDGKTSLQHWEWAIQINNLILLLHLLQQYLTDEDDVKEVKELICQNLEQQTDGPQVIVGEYVVADEELRHLLSENIQTTSELPLNQLA
ncbi:MAG: hypothetical protein HUJ30_05710, partial [Gammaproteobacteria bacterium]|nr:hypothetical protein [Gammaproteobacteria bacterium]